MKEAVFRADRLRELREREGKSCRVLSELLGLSPNAIRRYETGKRVPTLRNLCIIANHFGVSVEFFLDFSQ